MKVVADPNWLTIVGLIYMLFGLSHLASIATVRPPSTEPHMLAEDRAALRSVRATYSIGIITLATAALVAAQLVLIPFGGFAVIALLALAFATLTFALVQDSWAASIACPTIVGTAMPSEAMERSSPQVQALEPRKRIDLVHAAN